MKDPIKVSDRLSAGGQPTEDDLHKLVEAGFKSVVNLRMEGEKNQPMSPDTERAKAEAAGLGYHHVPVSVTALGTDDLDAFRKAIEDYRGLCTSTAALGNGPAHSPCSSSVRTRRQMRFSRKPSKKESTFQMLQ